LRENWGGLYCCYDTGVAYCFLHIGAADELLLENFFSEVSQTTSQILGKPIKQQKQENFVFQVG